MRPFTPVTTDQVQQRLAAIIPALFAIDGNDPTAPLYYEAEIWIDKEWSFPRFTLRTLRERDLKYYRSSPINNDWASSARSDRTSDAECLMFNGDYSRVRIRRSGVFAGELRSISTGMVGKEQVSNHARLAVAPLLEQADMLDLLKVA